MPFRFKQYTVDDAGCPMKVGTDSVLLGAWANLENSRTVLDIGTGCGLLALIAAQRSEASVTAIEIDPDAVKAANNNFKSSPWPGRLKAICISLQKFTEDGNMQLFDHIISNPPYFINSLKAPDPERSNARHTDQLPYELLASASAKLLKPDGRLSLVLPMNESEIFRKISEDYGLYINNKLNIVPKEGKPANRVLMEFGLFENLYYWEETLMIRDQSGDYTNDYKELTREFYLNF
jgi:tRNA1Val (adenine37-N6)-methyltransferase